jgi:hypothetical protein
VKNLYPLFWEKSSELVSLIRAEIDSKPNPSGALTKVIDIDDWSGRIGLDIIGKAGFGSDFNALSNPHAPLNESYRNAFIPDSKSAIIFLLSMQTGHKDIISSAMKTNAFTTENLVDQSKTLLGAGHET